jgi:Tfp pilus assembly protein PilF
LPLENIGTNPEDAFFSEGLTRDINSQLSKFSNLFVIAPSSAKEFQKNADCARIRKELKAYYILEGTVRRSSNDIRARFCLEHAVRDEPGYSLGWSRLAFSYVESKKYSIDPPEDWAQRSRQAAYRAIGLDASNPDAYYALAILSQMTGEDRITFQNFAEKAVQLTPNDAFVSLNWVRGWPIRVNGIKARNGHLEQNNLARNTKAGGTISGIFITI